MRDHGREIVVGLVFFALMGVLGWVTLTVGREAFEETEAVSFRFENASGLAEGAEVWINGVPSGTVKTVGVDPDGTVRATTMLRNPLSALDLSKGAVVEVRDKSTLGGAVLSVTLLRKHDGKAPTDLAALQERVWTAKTGGFGAVGEAAVEELVESSEASPGFLGKALLGEKGLDDLTKSLESLRSMVDRIERMTADADAGKGVLGMLLKDDETAASLKRTVTNLESLTEKATAGKGLLPRLLDDPATADRFDRILEDLQSVTGDLREGKGTMGRLLKDESLYEDLRASVADIRKFTEGIGDADGLLPRLLRDEALADDFEKTLTEARGSFEDLRLVAADVRAGKGTLGKLMTDESLYHEVRDAVRSLRRSFEESRENAPILTFAGFLFRTF
jgi:phospholipid/cholesterol/gamma-HCH transport system substrate-binding protein